MKKLINQILVFVITFLCVFSLSNAKKVVLADANTLRIYNWQDYIDDGIDEDGNKVSESVVDLWKADYQRRTGKSITVVYDTFETNETMLNTIKTGKTTYDLVCPSEYTIQKMIRENMLEKFDTNGIDGYLEHVSPYLKNLFEKNGWTEYAACYMWGTLGIIYNTEYVSAEDVEHWSAMWNEAYKNKVSTKDSVRDTYFMGVMYVYQEELMGYSEAYKNGELTQEAYNAKINEVANRIDDETLKKVEVALKELKNNIYGLEVDSGKSDIVTGKINMNLAWSGDAVYSMDLAEEDGVELSYSVPTEGSNVWFDGWCMPKGANKVLAQDFINFISQPEIAAKNMEKIGYTTSIVGDEIFDLIQDWYGSDSEDAYAVDLSFLFGDSLSEDRLSDGKVIVMTDELGRQFSTQYPDEEVLARCGVMQDFGNQNEQVLKMWTRFKANTMSPVVIVLLCVVGVGAVGACAFFIVKNKKYKKNRKHR